MPVAKTRNGRRWTEARFRSFVISAIRKATMRWGPKNDAKKAARYPDKLPNPETGRLVFHSICDGCGNVVPETTSRVDHIDPIVDPAVGFVSWDMYIERTLVEENGFQVLCTPCHDAKTKQEREIATERKRRERGALRS